MFPNLRAEMARLNLSYKDVAEVVGKSAEWLDSRFRGNANMPIDAAIKIKNKFFPSCKYEYLFAHEPIGAEEVDEKCRH